MIHPSVTIGNDFKIYHNVTIGGRKGKYPTHIGDHVYIGAGACILGDVSIGNHVTIGANAVVLEDVPDYHVAVGVPAIIRKRVIDPDQESC